MKDKIESKASRIKKWLTKTPYTIALVVMIVAAYIGINIVVKEINPTDIDLTTDKIYSLSDTSKNVAKSINKDVTIILVNMKEAESLIDFSHKYAGENNKITVREVENVNKLPELATKYALTEDASFVLIRSGNKEKIITSQDLYTYDYTSGNYKDKAEESLTNAIINVTVDKKPVIYGLIGHNRYPSQYLYYFTQELQSEANEYKELNLLTKKSVPKDCDVLVITTLENDLTKSESNEIISYIKKGGKIALFTDANVDKTSMPNFQKVLDQYGISISSGIMIEQDTDKMLTGAPSAVLVDINRESSFTKSLNMNLSACFLNTGKINFKSEEELEKLKVEVENIATTSEKSFYRSDLKEESTRKIKGDEEGSATVGALLTKKINDKTTSKLIVYSNNMFITNLEIPITQQESAYVIELYNNKDLALNSISYLSERNDTIIVRKSTEETTYTVTQKQQNIILAIIFAVPAVIIISGIVVWQVRRRKK